jgi:hypothetical protein
MDSSVDQRTSGFMGKAASRVWLMFIVDAAAELTAP